MKIALVGATGKVGGLVLARLKGRDVRALARTDESMRKLEACPGVEVFQADLDEADTLEPALRGVDVLFIATPFHPQQAARELAAVQAAERVGVSRIVKVSSYAAGIRPIAPSAAAHVQLENWLRQSSMSWSSLRPDWWLDNVLTQVDHIREGVFFFPAGDAVVTAVDARDLADVAVAEILADVPMGGVLVVTGPDSVGYEEIAERLGKAASIPLVWRDEAAPEWPDFYAQGMDKLFESYRARGFAPRTHVIAEVLSRPARTLEDFGSEVLVRALSGRGRGFHV